MQFWGAASDPTVFDFGHHMFRAAACSISDVCIVSPDSNPGAGGIQTCSSARNGVVDSSTSDTPPEKTTVVRSSVASCVNLLHIQAAEAPPVSLRAPHQNFLKIRGTQTQAYMSGKNIQETFHFKTKFGHTPKFGHRHFGCWQKRTRHFNHSRSPMLQPRFLIHL